MSLIENIIFLFGKLYLEILKAASCESFLQKSKYEIFFSNDLKRRYILNTYISKRPEALEMSKIYMFYKVILRYLCLRKIKSTYRFFSKVCLLYISFWYVSWFENIFWRCSLTDPVIIWLGIPTKFLFWILFKGSDSIKYI